MNSIFTPDENDLLDLLKTCADRFNETVGSIEAPKHFRTLHQMVVSQAIERPYPASTGGSP